MCPAALLVGAAFAKRLSGGRGPLFQITVVRNGPRDADTSQVSVQPRSQGHAEPICESMPNSQRESGIGDNPPSREDTVEGDEIDSADSTASAAAESVQDDIYRRIVDFNLALRSANQQPLGSA